MSYERRSPMRESVFQPRENVGNAAQPGLAPDCLQRPLRSHSQARLKLRVLADTLRASAETRRSLRSRLVRRHVDFRRTTWRRVLMADVHMTTLSGVDTVLKEAMSLHSSRASAVPSSLPAMTAMTRPAGLERQYRSAAWPDCPPRGSLTSSTRSTSPVPPPAGGRARWGAQLRWHVRLPRWAGDRPIPDEGTRVDPVRHTVRVEGWGQVGRVRPRDPGLGLATTGGTDPDTGIAGLTLGGGLAGWGINSRLGQPAPSISSPPTASSAGQRHRVP